MNSEEDKNKEKIPYKPGLLRDVDKALIEKLNDAEKIQLTVDGYNRTAEDWDKTRQNFWPEIIAEIKKYIRNKTNIIPEEMPQGKEEFEENKIKILDLGCGNGRLIKELTDLNIDYVGVDPSHELINIARHKYPEYNLHCYDGVGLYDYSDESFDHVISIAVLHHLPPSNVIAWLKEANRVTKKNTISIFTTWNLSESNYDLNQNKDAIIGFVHHKNTRYVHYYDYKEIKEVFEKSGYSVLEVKEIKRESGMSNTVIIVRK